MDDLVHDSADDPLVRLRSALFDPTPDQRTVWHLPVDTSPGRHLTLADLLTFDMKLREEFGWPITPT